MIKIKQRFRASIIKNLIKKSRKTFFYLLYLKKLFFWVKLKIFLLKLFIPDNNIFY